MISFSRLVVLCLLFCGFAEIPAQQLINRNRSCGTQPPSEAWDNWFNAKVAEQERDIIAGRGVRANYTIPVVVHIIHSGQSVGQFPNLSQGQVISQINVLNQDFAGNGTNVNTAPAPFSTLVANCNISFCLAQLDPDGNPLPEAGIDRINYKALALTPTVYPSQSDFMTYMDSAVKPKTIWDPARYLNIWVSERHPAADILGYASLPVGTGLPGISNGNGTAINDGVWVWSYSFGSTGQLIPPFNLGRTCTHEIGHWLGLRHVWGDASCGNDFCNDTPTQREANFGCATYPRVTCSNGPNGDMFMNFMDYGDDNCLYMFTPNQRSRMQTAMANGLLRKFHTASSATMCNLPPLQPTSAFQLNEQSCLDSAATVLNNSAGLPGPTYSWSAQPDNGVTFIPSATAANPQITFSFPGPYTISAVATNSAGTNSSSKTLFVNDCLGTFGIGENGLAKHVQVMPNPASESVVVRFPSNSGQTNIVLYNALSQEVVSEVSHSSGELTMDVKNLPAGVYYLTIKASGEKAVKRLIITH